MAAPEASLDQVTRWGKLPAWWLLHPETDADRLAVMAALATYADDVGFCEPSQATLAKRLGRSRPWANRVVADLASVGLLRKEGRSRLNGGTTSCRYQLAQTPEQAKVFAAEFAAEGVVPSGTGACPTADTPRHRRDTSHADTEQIQDTRPDARRAGDGLKAVPASTPRASRFSVDDGRSEPSRDWRPSDGEVSEALRLCPDADLDAHTAHFVARCRAKGYRYAPGTVGDAWLAWLLEDRRSDARRATETQPLAARRGRPVTPA